MTGEQPKAVWSPPFLYFNFPWLSRQMLQTVNFYSTFIPIPPLLNTLCRLTRKKWTKMKSISDRDNLLLSLKLPPLIFKRSGWKPLITTYSFYLIQFHVSLHLQTCISLIVDSSLDSLCQNCFAYFFGKCWKISTLCTFLLRPWAFPHFFG